MSECAYLVRFSNGVWKAGKTGEMRKRIKSLNGDARQMGRTTGQTISAEIRYIFDCKPHGMGYIENVLLNATGHFKRYLGREYFVAPDDEMDRIVSGLGLRTMEMPKTRMLSGYITDESAKILSDYQNMYKIRTRDEALDTLLLEFQARRKA